jgi:hypothetical protein
MNFTHKKGVLITLEINSILQDIKENEVVNYLYGPNNEIKIKITKKSSVEEVVENLRQEIEDYNGNIKLLNFGIAVIGR